MQDAHARASWGISPGSLQDLLTRTCTKSCKDVLQVSTKICTISCPRPVQDHAKTSCRHFAGPVQDHAGSSERISPGSRRQDLITRTCTRSCKTSWRISPGALQDHARPLGGFLQELYKILKRLPGPQREDLTRSSYKNLLRASQESFHTKHIQGRTSFKIFMQEAL